jgi:hypothetical protein
VAVNAPQANSPNRTAAITGGTADAVAAVPLPERRDHEAQQQLELVAPSGGRGGAAAPPPVPRIRWLP